eukprot:12962389-Heterocapsa_arctica.AAC.1
MVNNDTHISGHSPVRLNIGGKLSEDIGSRIKRPVDFQGISRKEEQMKPLPKNIPLRRKAKMERNMMAEEDLFNM